MATMYNCENQPSKATYDEIRKLYEEAYECLNKALHLDESGKLDEAINMYEFSLTLIDHALNLPLESPNQPDIEWEKVYAMIQKMRKSRKEVLNRISDAQSQPHADAALPPPSYEEAMAAGPSTSNMTIPPRSSVSNNVQAQMVPPPYIPSSAYAHVDNNHDKDAPNFSDLNAQLSDLRVTGNREIIYSHNNVRLYFIAPDGRVSATSQPDTLIIGRIEDMTHNDVLDETLLNIVDQLSAEAEAGQVERDHKRHGGRHSSHGRHRRHRHRGHATGDPGSRQPIHARTLSPGDGQIYLQVGSWVYPLLPGISPVFRSEYGAFILPDVHSEVEGAAVGLILPPNADQSVYELLNTILLSVVSQNDLSPKQPEPPRRSRRSDRTDKKVESKFAANVVKGASYLANNLVRGAGSASRFLDATAPRIMNKLNPATEPQPINPAIKTSVGVAKTVSGKAATMSDFLAEKVGNAATALGQYLSPHIQKGGTLLLTSTTKMNSDEASNRVQSFIGATAGAVQGIATVYNGLENAAGILGRSLANNTVQIIEYKYGKPVGEVTGDAVSTAGNVYTIHGNYKFLKPTKLAKTVAKSTIRGASTSMSEGPHEEFQGAGPGAGQGFGPLAAANTHTHAPEPSNNFNATLNSQAIQSVTLSNQVLPPRTTTQSSINDNDENSGHSWHLQKQ